MGMTLMKYAVSDYYFQMKGSSVMIDHLISMATDKRSVLKEFKTMLSFR